MSASPLHIRLDELSDPRIEQFMQEHLRDMRAISPPESVHALNMAQLRSPDIAFYTAWMNSTEDVDQPRLAGTGALRRLDADHAELKSMRTAQALRGQGVARQLLQHLLVAARQAGYQRISLETGTEPFFDPAVQLYRRHGFSDCAPFAHYRPDPHSRFMTLALNTPRAPL